MFSTSGKGFLLQIVTVRQYLEQSERGISSELLRLRHLALIAGAARFLHSGAHLISYLLYHFA